MKNTKFLVAFLSVALGLHIFVLLQKPPLYNDIVKIKKAFVDSGFSNLKPPNTKNLSTEEAMKKYGIFFDEVCSTYKKLAPKLNSLHLDTDVSRKYYEKLLNTSLDKVTKCDSYHTNSDIGVFLRNVEDNRIFRIESETVDQLKKLSENNTFKLRDTLLDKYKITLILICFQVFILFYIIFGGGLKQMRDIHLNLPMLLIAYSVVGILGLHILYVATLLMGIIFLVIFIRKLGR